MKRKAACDTNERARESLSGFGMLDILEGELGIDDARKSRRGEVTTLRRETADFDERSDSFRMSTHMCKLLVYIFDCIRNNSLCNIRFCPMGMRVFSMYHGNSVCIETRLGKDVFNEFVCEREVEMSVNLTTIAKKIACIYKFKAHKLTFNNKEQDLQITGCSSDGYPLTNIMLKPMLADVVELDFNGFSYPVMIQLSSGQIAKQIESMTPVFTMYIDMSIGGLVLEGSDHESNTKHITRLDQDVLEAIKPFQTIVTYRESFLKNNLQYIVRGARLSEHVTIGLSRDLPLCVRFLLNRSTVNNNNNSYISMFFSPSIHD